MRLVVNGRKVQRIKRKSIAGQCVLVLLALQLLFLSSFVALQLPSATTPNLMGFARLQTQNFIAELPPLWQSRILATLPRISDPVPTIHYDAYAPQAPTAIFLGYTFGFPIATIAVAAYVLAGMLGPFFGIYLFAAGGGMDYWTQPGFGYLIGMVVASWLVAKITAGPRTTLRQVAGLTAGVVTIHLLGVLYILGCSLSFGFLDGANAPAWLSWVFEQIRNLSLCAMPYDAMFGIVLIGLGFPIRSLVSMLTAPDIELKSRADVNAQRQIEELLHY